MLKELLKTAFNHSNVDGIVTYLEYKAVESYKLYDGDKSTEKTFVGGTIPFCNKVLALLEDEDLVKTIPPPKCDGEESLNNWKSELYPLITEKYEVFNNFLIEKGFVQEKKHATRTLLKNKNSKIMKEYGLFFGTDVLNRLKKLQQQWK